jgi:hypothetical protein
VNSGTIWGRLVEENRGKKSRATVSLRISIDRSPAITTNELIAVGLLSLQIHELSNRSPAGSIIPGIEVPLFESVWTFHTKFFRAHLTKKTFFTSLKSLFDKKKTFFTSLKS